MSMFFDVTNLKSSKCIINYIAHVYQTCEIGVNDNN